MKRTVHFTLIVGAVLCALPLQADRAHDIAVCKACIDTLVERAHNSSEVTNRIDAHEEKSSYWVDKETHEVHQH